MLNIAGDIIFLSPHDQFYIHVFILPQSKKRDLVRCFDGDYAHRQTQGICLDAIWSCRLCARVCLSWQCIGRMMSWCGCVSADDCRFAPVSRLMVKVVPVAVGVHVDAGGCACIQLWIKLGVKLNLKCGYWSICEIRQSLFSAESPDFTTKDTKKIHTNIRFRNTYISVGVAVFSSDFFTDVMLRWVGIRGLLVAQHLYGTYLIDRYLSSTYTDLRAMVPSNDSQQRKLLNIEYLLLTFYYNNGLLKKE